MHFVSVRSECPPCQGHKFLQDKWIKVSFNWDFHFDYFATIMRCYLCASKPLEFRSSTDQRQSCNLPCAKQSYCELCTRTRHLLTTALVSTQKNWKHPSPCLDQKWNSHHWTKSSTSFFPLKKSVSLNAVAYLVLLACPAAVLIF